MANGQQGGSGGGAGYAAIIPQLVGAGLQIATARPTRQERQQRRIAMGAPDPAVEALRRRLATQQLQTAMAAAAGQPGINPALALRQAQAGLAQSEIGTAAQLASQQARSVEQARSSDPLARRRDAALSGVGGMLNILGTGLATQAAGRQAAEQDAAAAQKAALAMQAPPQAPVAETGMAAPGGVEVTPPAGAETTVALPPTVEPTVQPSAAPTEVQTTEEVAAAAPSATGVEDLGALERRGAPGPVAEGAAPTERAIVAPPGVVTEETAAAAPTIASEEELAIAEQSIADEVQARMSAGLGGIQQIQPTIVQQPQMEQPVATGTPGAMTPGTTIGSGEELGLVSRPVTTVPVAAPVERQIEGPEVVVTPQQVQAVREAEVAQQQQQALADQVEARMRSGMERVRTPSVTTPTGGVPEPTGLPQADLDQITRQDLMRQREPGRRLGGLGELESRPVSRQIMETPGQARERRIEQVRATLPQTVANDTRNQALIESLADAEEMGDPELVQMIRALIEAEAGL